MHAIFANTGVQYICETLPAGTRFAASAVGQGWQRCRCQQPDGEITPYHFVQWKIGTGRLILAVDTTCGDPEKGYFCHPDAFADDFPVILDQILDLEDKPLAEVPRLEILIRPATAGAGSAKPVHMVIDFGNSRTGALLLEPDREGTGTPLMEPFELINRLHLDAWDDAGRFQKQESARWFSSRTHWCASPYLPPPRLEHKIYLTADGRDKGLSGLFGARGKAPSKTVFVTPRLFQDLSAVRLGQEGDNVARSMRTEGTVLCGVSSPKRYLWADDASWLQGAIWHMADPDDRCETGDYAATLQGPLLRFLAEDDPDDLDLPAVDDDAIPDDEIARETPYKPHHAPRTLMVVALYELLCQAYTYVNSLGYRELTGDPGRPRELRALILTYPSGMISDERERLQQQARKAIELFRVTLGRTQEHQPTLTLSIDEASAVHLSYIWSELQMVNKDPRLWFSLVGRKASGTTAEESAADEGESEDTAQTPPSSQSRARQRRVRPSRRRTAQREDETPAGEELRIACIDIGGGTTDLMIAKYHLEAGAVDSISGEVLHRDGISVAGDQLVKRILERIIIPEFADRVGMQPDEVDRLFGQQRPWNLPFRAQRIAWINRLFVPLAQAYLQNAVDESDDVLISHTDPEYVDPDVVQSLQDTIDKQFGGGRISVFQDLRLMYDKEYFEDVVQEVFNDLLLDVCGRIVEHRADIVLLAGQPTKLKCLQDRVKMYLPFAASRVIPMHNYYAGTWYPYQDEQGKEPGVIVEPKSAVVVGAALESLISTGKLGAIRFQLKEPHAVGGNQGNRYYWGIMEARGARIRDDRVLFQPDDTTARNEFPVVSERTMIGRRLSGNHESKASPVWMLKVDKDDREGPIDITVTLVRTQSSKESEESLQLVAVKGDVAGEPAQMDGPDKNVDFLWRTLADEQYYLDTGSLDNIELE